MAKALCFGSLNIDYIYQVPHFVGAGETLSALSRQRLAGGKGLNQAVALSRAGAETYMAGSVGEDGEFLLETLQGAGVDISFVRQLPGNTGTAVIQRDGAGENCILLHGGANRCITESQVQETLEHFAPGDWLVLQNEISCLPLLLSEGRKRGMQVVFNPSPMEPDLLGLCLEKVHCLVLNQVEGRQLLGGETREERGFAPWAGRVVPGGYSGAHPGQPGRLVPASRGVGIPEGLFRAGGGYHRGRGCFHRLFRGQPHDGTEYSAGAGEGCLGRCPDHPAPRQHSACAGKLTIPRVGEG